MIELSNFLKGVEIGRRLKAMRNQPIAYGYDDMSLVFQPDTKINHLKTLVGAWSGWVQGYYSAASSVPWDNGTFRNYEWTSVRIEDEVSPYRTNYWFSSQLKLTDVYIGNKVQEIGTNMFYNCVSLRDITLPESVRSIGEAAFERCTNLATVRLPKNLYGLGREAFMYSGITSIELPEGLKTLNYNAFHSCPDLVSVSLPESLIEVSRQSFWDCPLLVHVKMGSNVQTIDQSAFHSCISLESITIPKTTTLIRGSAFADCEALTRVVFEDPKGWWYAATESETSGTAIDFSKSATAASILKTTYGSTYYGGFFRKS